MAAFRPVHLGLALADPGPHPASRAFGAVKAHQPLPVGVGEDFVSQFNVGIIREDTAFI